MEEGFQPFDLGRYHCIRKIGCGGMAEVYLAKLSTIEGFEKTFAVKKIHKHLAHSADFAQMFVHEARITATLDHGNIVGVTELNQDKGTYFIVMEYVDGVDLQTLLDFVASLKRTIPWDLAVYIVMEIARGLEYAHSNTDEDGMPMGIVHRDLSPSNVMISQHGEIKILDFGIARALLSDERSRQSTMKGKYAYMSPEQVRSDELDGRSDIFALGSLFYEMLKGKKLFEGTTAMETIRNVEKVAIPARFGVEPSLEPVLRKMLAGNPSARFTTARELMTILSRKLVARRVSVTQTDLASYLYGARLRAERIRKQKKKAAGGAPATPSPPAPAFARTTGVTTAEKRSAQKKKPRTTLKEVFLPSSAQDSGAQSEAQSTAAQADAQPGSAPARLQAAQAPAQRPSRGEAAGSGAAATPYVPSAPSPLTDAITAAAKNQGTAPPSAAVRGPSGAAAAAEEDYDDGKPTAPKGLKSPLAKGASSAPSHRAESGPSSAQRISASAPFSKPAISKPLSSSFDEEPTEIFSDDAPAAADAPPSASVAAASPAQPTARPSGTSDPQLSSDPQLPSIDDFDDYEQTIVDPNFGASDEGSTDNASQAQPNTPGQPAGPGNSGGTGAQSSAPEADAHAAAPRFGSVSHHPLAGAQDSAAAMQSNGLSPETQAVDTLGPASHPTQSSGRGLQIAIVLAVVAVVAFAGFAIWLYLDTQGDTETEQTDTKTQNAADDRPKHRTGADDSTDENHKNTTANSTHARTDGSAATADGGTAAHTQSEDGATAAPKIDRAAALKKLQVTVGPITDSTKRAHVDLKTMPEGANVIIGKLVLGKTPLRLGLKPGRPYVIALNKERHSVIVQKLKVSKKRGRTLAVELPPVKKPARKARTGRTAVMVECAPPGVHRVYLNGWDSGYNCPVALETDPGKNNIGFRIPGTLKKMHYQDFVVRTGQLTEVKRNLSQ